MFSCILSFLDHVFLLPREEVVFEELYEDRNEHYRADIADWALDGSFVALAYNDSLKSELESYKYHSIRRKKDVFAPFLRKTFDLFLAELTDRDAIVTGVPLFFLSKWKRGYNQSDLLARDIARGQKLPFLPLLRKTRWTRHQARLDRSGRLANLRDVFRIRPKYRNLLSGKTVILVDDIVSTGTTANECAKVLKQAGAKNVYGLFLGTGG